MENRRLRFGLGIFVLVSAVVWLGMSGYEEGKAYYKTADEFVKLDRASQSRRIRLMGDVAKGSISHDGGVLAFSVTLNGATVPIVYRGSDPLPDTFKDGVQALVEGTMGPDGVFVGQKIQAKCASKYEADPAKSYGKTRDGKKMVSGETRGDAPAIPASTGI